MLSPSFHQSPAVTSAILWCVLFILFFPVLSSVLWSLSCHYIVFFSDLKSCHEPSWAFPLIHITQAPFNFPYYGLCHNLLVICIVISGLPPVPHQTELLVKARSTLKTLWSHWTLFCLPFILPRCVTLELYHLYLQHGPFLLGSSFVFSCFL